MKKLSYIFLVAAGAMLASCSGHEEYDAYVKSLKGQPEIIDTISSPTSYAEYLDSLAVRANAFEQLGVKLDPTQKEELSTLSMKIQEALVSKYDQLSNQMSNDGTVLDASAPVTPTDEVGDSVISVSME